jgi:molybdate transport system substrate-binding protein
MSIVVMLAACGSQTNTTTDQTTSKNQSNQVETETNTNKTINNKDKSELIELTISAAASLTDALNELKKRYEQQYPNVNLNFNYGASGALQRQIEQGAPADLFISASDSVLKSLEEKGFVKDGIPLLQNELVVIVPASGGSDIKQLDDLKDDSIKKLAIGIPDSVPAGKYAQESLTNQKLWDGLQAKLVQAKDVRQVLQYVATGNADAGFVYKTDALSTNETKIAFTVDVALHSAITYPIGLVTSTSHEEEARQLYDYLKTEPAIKIMEKYGFRRAN